MTAEAKVRLEWREQRQSKCGAIQFYFIIAEFIATADDPSGRWRFFERYSFDLRWDEIPATPQLFAQVEEKLFSRPTAFGTKGKLAFAH